LRVFVPPVMDERKNRSVPLVFTPDAPIEGHQMEVLARLGALSEIRAPDIDAAFQVEVFGVIVQKRRDQAIRAELVVSGEEQGSDAEIALLGIVEAALSARPTAKAGTRQFEPTFFVPGEVGEQGRDDLVTPVGAFTKEVQRREPVVAFARSNAIDDGADDRRTRFTVAQIPEHRED